MRNLQCIVHSEELCDELINCSSASESCHNELVAVGIGISDQGERMLHSSL